MNIQETIDNLKQQVENLQNEVIQLQKNSKAQQNKYRNAGSLHPVSTKSGGNEKMFPTLDEAVDYYSALRKRLLARQLSGSRATVELEIYKTDMLFNQCQWEQF